ncbi:LysM peptidoglycan-binding domain-containing protein [Microvirga sp. GCM10011540]|uniref:LysM peptidoglycan-binding domain-containing protein n=1 Tax=Microvirga sp. GCM10011540 TaxID=3317338 RepID=UPI00361E3697
MANEKQNRGTIAALGASAAAVVAVLLGVLYWERSENAAKTEDTPPVAARPGENSGTQVATALPQAPLPQGALGEARPKPETSPEPARVAPNAPVAPSFDVVRIEPDGESVIAGRAAPGATIELLRGDLVHARAAADASGLFAIVPPPLPPGSHQIALQSIAPDGTRQRSRESVTVVLDTAKTRPLVALTAPDKPTVLLSNPEPPEAKTAQPAPAPAEQPTAQPAAPETKTAETPAQPAPQQQANAAPGAAPPAPTEPAAPAAPRPEIKIVTVEAEEGKLFVSGQSAPGATVRLYLNESFVAPGGAGGDGKVSFAIGSGVKPGDYRVRLDDVDPVSGQVKSRAQVAFNVPAQVAAAAQPQTQAQAAAPFSMTAPAPAAGTAAPAPSSPSVAGSSTAGGTRTASADASILPEGTVVIPNINTAIVSKGDNLWRISQRTYGKGMRYTVIYGANQEQIRNPDLIYPGQVFVLPGDEPKKTN